MNSRLPLSAWPDDAGIVEDAAAAEAFVIDWRKRYRGRALAVAQPRSTEAVAALVRHCAQAGIPIVPQGGNTGLVGGGTPDDSGRALV